MVIDEPAYSEMFYKSYAINLINNVLKNEGYMKVKDNYVEESDHISINYNNKTLKNAYLMLALCFMGSALAAWMSTNGIIVLPDMMMSPLILLACNIGFVMAIQAFRNHAAGFFLLLGFSLFFGAYIGPGIAHVADQAPQAVTNALFVTVLMFVSLSYIATKTRYDFRKWQSFFVIGLMAVIVMHLLGYYTEVAVSTTLLSSAIVIIASGLTLSDTQTALRDPHANYLTVSVSLFLNIINLFMALLNIMNND